MINEAFREPEYQTVPGMVACLEHFFFYYYYCVLYFTANPTTADNIKRVQTYHHASRKEGRTDGKEGWKGWRDGRK